MIISDEHRLVFVHIPKNGGTSVREQLAGIDSHANAWFGFTEHPVLGRVDRAHLTMRLLKAYDPDTFEKVRRYDAFALLREPHERFGSSLREHLLLSTWKYATEFSDSELLRHAGTLMDKLASTDLAADSTLVHFTRQVDFVELDGERIVNRLFALRDIAACIDAIAAKTGLKLDRGRHANRNLAFRHRGLARLAYRVNDVLSRTLPKGMHTAVKRAAVPLVSEHSSASEKAGLVELPEIRAFVDAYYADDIALYAETERARAPDEDKEAHLAD